MATALSGAVKLLRWSELIVLSGPSRCQQHCEGRPSTNVAAARYGSQCRAPLGSAPHTIHRTRLLKHITSQSLYGGNSPRTMEIGTRKARLFEHLHLLQGSIRPKTLQTGTRKAQSRVTCRAGGTLASVDDYYGLLGVSQSVDKAELKRAYRKLALVFHPDVNKDEGAQENFVALSNAYEVRSFPFHRTLTSLLSLVALSKAYEVRAFLACFHCLFPLRAIRSCMEFAELRLPIDSCTDTIFQESAVLFSIVCETDIQETHAQSLTTREPALPR
jgi:hypothetical protein